MKYILNQTNYLFEKVTDTRVICDKCGWDWAIVDGSKDLYVCHKCWTDNTPKDTLK